MTKRNSATSDYAAFVAELRERIASSRLSAARAVNRELVRLYWDIGSAILKKQAAHGWGQAVVASLGRDLHEAFPGNSGFSASNLWRMRQVCEAYTAEAFLAQVVRERQALPGVPSSRAVTRRPEDLAQVVREMNETNQELTSANQQLDRMHVEAASALETRSMFFTSASHDFRQRLHAMKLLSHSALGACRAWGAEAKLGPSEDSFCRVCRPIAEAMGQEAGEKWTAAAQLQPALPKPDRLLEHASASCNAVQASLKRLTESVEEVERYVTDVLDFARLAAVIAGRSLDEANLRRLALQ